MTILKAINPVLETTLLKNLSVEVVYSKYIQYIDYKRLLPTTKILLEDYQRYFNLYPNHTMVDWGHFYTQFAQNWHLKDMEQSDIDYYRDYVFPAIENCAELEIDKCLLGITKKLAEEEIAECMTKDFDIHRLRSIIDLYETNIDNIDMKVDKTVHTIENENFDTLDKTNGIPWFLPSLQQNLMSITAGQFIIVSADFGTGKTAFVVHQAVKTFLHNVKRKDDRPILYFNSEGTASDVLGRFLSNLYREKILGGFEEIVDRRIEVREKFLKVYNPNNFVVIQVSDAPTFNAIKAKIQKYKPCLTIIDICDKLAPDEDPQSLKKLYDNLRVLAGSECPIIGTSQSGNTSYLDKEKGEFVQRKWLDGHDTYGSKVGKPGAADTMIMIGAEKNSPLRYISVTKKKRGKEVKITCELLDRYSFFRELTL